MYISSTYDTMECHTIAIGPIHSWCSTMDLALRRQHFGNSFQHFELVETHLAVECVDVVSVSPISGMECHFL